MMGSRPSHAINGRLWHCLRVKYLLWYRTHLAYYSFVFSETMQATFIPNRHRDDDSDDLVVAQILTIT